MVAKRVVWGAALCVLMAAAAGRAKVIRTVTVDCAKGDSIATALAEKADELVVEISGVVAAAHVAHESPGALAYGGEQRSRRVQQPANAADELWVALCIAAFDGNADASRQPPFRHGRHLVGWQH